MKIRKRKLPRQAWIVIDRYDAWAYPSLDDIHKSKASAVSTAQDEIERGYTANGKLSVVRILFDADTEIQVTQRKGKAE